MPPLSVGFSALVVQQTSPTADVEGVRPSTRTIESPSAADAVAVMLAYVGPALADGGRAYARLAKEVERELAHRGEPRGWEALDVAAFVLRRARGRRGRIEVCCNLAAILAWVWRAGAISRATAAKLYDDLAAVCPDDPEAQAYIEWGGERAREDEGAGPSHAARPPSGTSS